jgi:hypothetical protein
MDVYKVFSITMIALMLSMTIDPAVRKVYGEDQAVPSENRGNEVLAPFRDLKDVVIGLLEVCDDPTDTDNDTLPDKVEWVIGTDPGSNDTDRDQLTDRFEAMNGLDPQNVDSNQDGNPDRFEVEGVVSDIDMDGLPNAWDEDNDGDGVGDDMDLSPQDATSPRGSFRFNITATGKPLYLTIQLRPRNPDHLRLFGMDYDWPYDTLGSMRDMDNSKDDISSMPSLLIETDMALDQEEVVDYGMTLNDGNVILPLSPVIEDGMNAAFVGKMFIPATDIPTTFSMDIRLKWTINAMNDYPGAALEWGDGNQISYDMNGTVMASTPLGSTFMWIDLGGGRIALKDLYGRFLVSEEDGSVGLSGPEMGEGAAFEKIAFTGGFNLQDDLGRYLAREADGDIVTISSASPSSLLWSFEDRGVCSEPTVLAVYDEPMVITGFSVEENYGCGVGIIYDSDIDMLNAANFALSNIFLRNGTVLLSDLPDHFEECGITSPFEQAVFSHSDEAIMHAMDVMKPKALSSFPDGELSAMTILVDRKFTSVTPFDLFGGGRSISGPFRIDMGNQSVAWTRALKTSYYSLPDEVALEEEDVIERIAGTGLQGDDLDIFLGFAIPWMAGEQTQISYGMEFTQFEGTDFDETAELISNILGYGLSAIAFISDIPDYYEVIVKMVKKCRSVFSAASVAAVKSTAKAVSAVSTAKKASFIDKLGVLDVIEICLAIGLSIYAFFTIASAYDWSAVGVGIAVLYSVMMMVYSIIMLVMGTNPYTMVLAFIIELADMIVGWITGSGFVERLMNWIIDLVTDFRERTTVDLSFGRSSLDIVDLEKNGLTAGDSIVFTLNSTGYVNATGYGSTQDVTDGYIKPVVRAVGGDYRHSRVYEYVNVLGETNTGLNKVTQYQSGFNSTPDIGMINHAITYWIRNDYKIFYEECWWFFGWWCDRKESSDQVDDNNRQTLYFDVMPRDMDEFGNWRVIVPKDADGDGIDNVNETGTDPWKWDTDGDGLSDKFEPEIGADPLVRDMDGDGSSDGTEFGWSMDMHSADSDKDGLGDFLEHRGWTISFEFCGRNFNWTINSDPKLNDTDGDGINDYLEFLCKLNPRSSDTDGDGRIDLLRDYLETTIEYKREVSFGYHDFTVFPNGTMIGIRGGDFPAVDVYDRSGAFLAEFDVEERISAIALTPDGKLLLCGSQNVWLYGDDWTIESTYAFDPSAMWVYDMCANDTTIILSTSMDSVMEIILIDISTGENYNPGWIFPGKFGDLVGIAVAPNGNIFISEDRTDQVFLVDPEFAVSVFGGSGSGEGQFSDPRDILCDENGDILIADMGNHRIQKFDQEGNFIMRYDGEDVPSGTFDPWYMGIDGNRTLNVLSNVYYGTTLMQFHYNVTVHNFDEVTGFPDTDNDGVPDDHEIKGKWIAVETDEGRRDVNATSDPRMTDTDFDGVDDHLEWNLSSDPRSSDTDGDGLPDAVEYGIGSNLSSWDTDGDGLGDAEEVGFLSSPLLPDTDGDRLSDIQEWLFQTDPNDPDSDGDGLSDGDEYVIGSDPLDPDSDGDFMYDSTEDEEGTDPNDPDNDRDGIDDGYEPLYGSDPLSGDSDDDMLPDGWEIDQWLDPADNDTDGDGMDDGKEVEIGLNPRSSDSDGDGIKDSMDMDYLIELDEPIVLLYEPSDPVEGFVENLSSSADTVVGDPSDPSTYSDSRYIVIIGAPSDEEGTPGGIMTEILSATGILENMDDSDLSRFAVRYGEWKENQTVIMLTTPYEGDHIRTLGMLRSMRMMVKNGFVKAEVLNPRICYSIDNFEIVKETGSSIRARFSDNTTFNVTVERVGPVAFNREQWTGLGEMEVPLSRAVRFEIGSGHPILAAEIDILYNASDLDRSGDGTAGPGDFDETSIGLFFLNETSGQWERVTEDLDWVLSTNVNDTDLEAFGMHFSGRVQAMVGHLSTYVLTGRLVPDDTLLPVIADPGGDRTIFVGETLKFDGSSSTGNGGIFNFTWTIDGSVRYGSSVSATFGSPGVFNVTLAVLDQLGLSGTSTIVVTVRELPPTHFVLVLGPIIDKGGHPVPGALVRVSLGSEGYENTTDDAGFVRLTLPVSFLNRTVRLSISKDGYIPMGYDIFITHDGKLQGSLQRFNVIEPEPEKETNWLPVLIFFLVGSVILILLIILLGTGLLMWSRSRSGRIDEE